jgi:hypothetical protein
LRTLGAVLLLVALAAAEDLPTTLLWRHRLAERDARWTARYGFWIVALKDREEAEFSDAQLCYPAARPVIHDGAVYLRDGVELVVRRLSSGRWVFLRGRYKLTNESVQPVEDVRPHGERFHRFLDHAGNRCAMGDGRVFCVEDKGALAVAYSLSTGKTLWGWNPELAAMDVRRDPDRFERWKTDLEAHHGPRFLTAGLAVGSRYLTVAVSRKQLELWAFAAATGEVEYRVRLAPCQENAPDPDVALACRDGAVFVATNAGLAAAVDVEGGKLRWGYRYESDPGHEFNEPVVAGGKVILAAADMESVAALDARTGETAWVVSRGDGAHVVGVAGGSVVLAGKQVAALDVASGATRWRAQLEGDPFGRGFVDDVFAYVPSVADGAGRIERFDLKSSEAASPVKFDVPRLGNLLFADGRLLVVNGEEILCYGSVEAELKRANPLDRGELLMRLGRKKEAVAAFAEDNSVLVRDPAFSFFADDWKTARRFAYNDLTRAQVALARRHADPDLLDVDVVYEDEVMPLRQALEQLGAK